MKLGQQVGDLITKTKFMIKTQNLDIQDKNFSGLTLAIPKGRLAKEILPLLELVNLRPEPAFFDDKDRRLIFATENPEVRLVPIKPFDAATFVAFGGADLGIVGADVLYEFDYQQVYAPVDLATGHCRLSVAALNDYAPSDGRAFTSHLRVATKYPNLTRKHFAQKGIQAECIKLNGSIELGPKLNLCDLIVDIVTTGNTLKANGLKELETIIESSSRLIINRTRAKVEPEQFAYWVDAFKNATQQLNK